MQIKLSRTSHSNKAHNRTHRPQHNKQVEERAYSERRRKIDRILTHSENRKNAKQQKMEVINNQADCGIRKPTRGRSESGRSGETENGCDQPADTSRKQQQHDNGKEVARLGSSKLLLQQHQQCEHCLCASPSLIGEQKGAPSAHV